MIVLGLPKLCLSFVDLKISVADLAWSEDTGPFFVGLTFIFEYDTLYDFIFAKNSATEGEIAAKTWKNYLPYIALGGSFLFGFLVFIFRKKLF